VVNLKVALKILLNPSFLFSSFYGSQNRVYMIRIADQLTTRLTRVVVLILIMLIPIFFLGTKKLLSTKISKMGFIEFVSFLKQRFIFRNKRQRKCSS